MFIPLPNEKLDVYLKINSYKQAAILANDELVPA